MSLSTILSQIRSSDSGLNYYKNATIEHRIAQNSAPCNDNDTQSCGGYYRQLTPREFQTFDAERRTKYAAWEKDRCFRKCMHRGNPSLYCKNRCGQMSTDFV